MMDTKRSSTSFNQVYDRLSRSMYAFVKSRVNDPETAEDLVQDIFLKVHSHIGELDGKQKPDAWIYRIARNRITDYYRKHRPEPGLDADRLSPPSRTKEEILEEFTEDIREMIRRLPPRYREVIELTELKGVKQVDAARELGISLPAVKSRVLRGRELLREMLLDCCHFEFSKRGEVIGFTPRRYCRRCVTHGLTE